HIQGRRSTCRLTHHNNRNNNNMGLSNITSSCYKINRNINIYSDNNNIHNQFYKLFKTNPYFSTRYNPNNNSSSSSSHPHNNKITPIPTIRRSIGCRIRRYTKTTRVNSSMGILSNFITALNQSQNTPSRASWNQCYLPTALLTCPNHNCPLHTKM